MSRVSVLPTVVAMTKSATAPPIARTDDLQRRLDAALAATGVPGAVLAVGVGDELVEVAGGVLHRGTGAAATTDSWFQIGSVTKVLTGTLIMQLVDRGVVLLDDPVRKHLPGFALADPAAADTVTVRRLLNHTSGIDGDYFADFGVADDAVERYVASLEGVDQVHQPGAMFSYCNSGFSVLGRILEVHHGAPYAQVLAEHLLAPLGVDGGTTAAQAIMRRSAVGHVPGPDLDDGTAGPDVPAPAWCLPGAESAAPAGSTPMMSAAGLVAFARMHLAEGVTADGTRVLSAQAARAMREPQADVPGDRPLTGMGLAWGRYVRGGELVLGHNGGTLGQLSFLRVHPGTGTVVVLLTNGAKGGVVWRELGESVLAELTGLPTPPDPELPESALAVDAGVAGTFLRRDIAVEVVVAGAAIDVTTSTKPGTPAAAMGGESVTTRWLPSRVDADAVQFLSAELTDGVRDMLVFLGRQPDGSYRHVHHGGRAALRATGLVGWAP